MFPTSLCMLALALARFCTATSTISTFDDANCNDSLRSLTGPNGYPNGTCTDLRRNGPYGSFHIISLDAGCTVTIYKSDNTDDICTGDAAYQKIAAPLQCYGSEYVYYSIDFCDPAGIHSTSSPSTTASAGSKQSNTASIAGGVVGGVVALLALLGVGFWVWRRKHRAAGEEALRGQSITPVGELHAQSRSEMGTGKMVYRQDAHEFEVPPVEIGGTEVGGGSGGGYGKGA